MNVNSSSRLALVFALAILGASVASAQTFVGGVRGLVQDPSGQSLPTLW
jgi:F0F1-type ATP synthase membrane subunit c/vacuolar-type H+-ATPase subunit K